MFAFMWGDICPVVLPEQVIEQFIVRFFHHPHRADRSRSLLGIYSSILCRRILQVVELFPPHRRGRVLWRRPSLQTYLPPFSLGFLGAGFGGVQLLLFFCRGRISFSKRAIHNHKGSQGGLDRLLQTSVESSFRVPPL